MSIYKNTFKTAIMLGLIKQSDAGGFMVLCKSCDKCVYREINKQLSEK